MDLDDARPAGMAIIELSETSFIEAFWNVPCGPPERPVGDLLAVLYRDGPDAPWRLTSRTRTYVDAEAWGSKDRKTAYEVLGEATDASREDLAAKMDAVTAVLAAAGGTAVNKTIVHGNAHAFSAAFSRQPFAHVKVTPHEPTETM